MRNNSIDAFLAFLRAGLWEKEARLLPFGDVDYDDVEAESIPITITAGTAMIPAFLGLDSEVHFLMISILLFLT